MPDDEAQQLVSLRSLRQLNAPAITGPGSPGSPILKLLRPAARRNLPTGKTGETCQFASSRCA